MLVGGVSVLGSSFAPIRHTAWNSKTFNLALKLPSVVSALCSARGKDRDKASVNTVHQQANVAAYLRPVWQAGKTA